MRRSARLIAAALCAVGCGGRAFSDDRPGAPACGASASVPVPAADASALLLEGARVFYERCSPCHGDSGHGDGVLAELLPIRPRNYHRDPFRWGTSVDDVARTVRLGRSGVMPAFEGALSETETRAVAFLVSCWAERRADAGR